MQKTTHTLGPWHVQENGGPADGYNVLDERDRYIAFVDTSGEQISDEQAHVNARLIAEAPAMLEALRTLCDDLLTPASEWNKRKRIARALLAKIDGGADDNQ